MWNHSLQIVLGDASVHTINVSASSGKPWLAALTVNGHDDNAGLW
jgi:hypothetical protein